MRVFVLGAGASMHAGYPSAARLGAELAAWAQGNDAEGARYRDDLRKLQEEFGELFDFERIVTTLQEDLAAKRRTRLPDFGTAISKFFDSIRNAPAELYNRLATERISRGDVVITFNYDMAIERSLKATGLWEITNGYGSALEIGTDRSSSVKLLKLHGSTNWWGSIFGGAQGFSAVQDSIGERPTLFFDPDFQFLGYTDLRDPKAPRNSGLLSALILPTLNKEFYYQTTFGNEWERFWDSLWLEAEDALRATDEIVIIGYSMPAADERARTLLFSKSNHSARVTVCSHRQSQRIADEFREHGFTAVSVPASDTFESYLNGAAQRAGSI